MSTIWRFGLALQASVLALGCSPAAPDSGPGSGEPADDSRQTIVGGSTTSAFPATGALTLYGSLYCTGTLIAPRKVLTAAHCLQGVSASALAFAIGPDASAPQTVLAVAAITPNPSYDDQALSDDIGYVTLAKDAPVAPMPILAAMDSTWVGTSLLFVGYGITSGYGSGEGVKRSVTIPIEQVWQSQFEYRTHGKNTCNGDSGGPAYAKIGSDYFVAGVTSYGDAACTQYGVDTRVDVYAAFLGGSGGSGGAPSDPCQGETYQGRCQGNRVIWCENEQVQSLDCQSCGFDSARGFYNCL